MQLSTQIVDTLKGKALNFAVQKALGHETTEDGLGYWVTLCSGEGYEVHPIPDYVGDLITGWAFLYALKISYIMKSNVVQASFFADRSYSGNSYSEAGLRCFVGSKFPNGLVEIPNNLL